MPAEQYASVSMSSAVHTALKVAVAKMPKMNLKKAMDEAANDWIDKVTKKARKAVSKSVNHASE